MGAGSWAELNPAFPYRGQRLREARANGKLEEVTQVQLEQPNQFAREIDHLSQYVAENWTPHTPGAEGLADLRIIEPLYVSAQAGHALPPSSGFDVTGGPSHQEEG